MNRRLGRVLAILLILLLAIPTAVMADALPAYEPYTAEEFPIWSAKLRRAETLFFGSFPLTLPLVVAAYNIAIGLGAPPVEQTAGIKTAMVQLGVAAGVSLGIALTDFIIGQVKGE